MKVEAMAVLEALLMVLAAVVVLARQERSVVAEQSLYIANDQKGCSKSVFRAIGKKYLNS